MGAGEAAAEAVAAMEPAVSGRVPEGTHLVPKPDIFVLHNKGMATRKNPTPVPETPEPKRRGRPTLAEEDRRTARVAFRTYSDVAEKAARLGTPAIEALIRKAPEPK